MFRQKSKIKTRLVLRDNQGFIGHETSLVVLDCEKKKLTKHNCLQILIFAKNYTAVNDPLSNI